jgi:hypothetical protein
MTTGTPFRLISLSAQQAVSLHAAVFEAGSFDRKRKSTSVVSDSGIESAPSPSVAATAAEVSPKPVSAARFVPAELLLTTNKVVVVVFVFVDCSYQLNFVT